MPRFQKGNTFSKGRAKGSGFVDRCRKWADKKGWDILERVAEGKRPLDAKAEKKAIKEEGGLIKPKGKTYTISPIANDIPSEKLQRAARQTLIEYGYGKPRVPIDTDPDNKGDSLFGMLGEAARLNRERESGVGSPKPSKKRP